MAILDRCSHVSLKVTANSIRNVHFSPPWFVNVECIQRFFRCQTKHSMVKKCYHLKIHQMITCFGRTPCSKWTQSKTMRWNLCVNFSHFVSNLKNHLNDRTESFVAIHDQRLNSKKCSSECMKQFLNKRHNQMWIILLSNLQRQARIQRHWNQWIWFISRSWKGHHHYGCTETNRRIHIVWHQRKPTDSIDTSQTNTHCVWKFSTCRHKCRWYLQQMDGNHQRCKN